MTMRKSACADSALVAVLVFLAGSGSVAPGGKVRLAVLVTLPVAAGLIVAVTVNVTLLPAGKVAMGIPVPCMAVIVGAAGQAAPPVMAPQLTLLTVRLATAGSVKIVPFAALGPALLTTML